MARRKFSDVLKGSNSLNCDKQKTVKWGTNVCHRIGCFTQHATTCSSFHSTSTEILFALFIDLASCAWSLPLTPWQLLLKTKSSTSGIHLWRNGTIRAHGAIVLTEWNTCPTIFESCLYTKKVACFSMDIITTKAYDGSLFRNCTLIESGTNDQITNAIIHLDRGHQLIEAILNLLNADYDPDEYIFHGPQVVSLAVRQVCNLSFSHKSKACPNVRMLPHRFFYPIGNAFWGQFFEDSQSTSGQNILQRISVGYGFHIWNNLSNKKVIDISDNSTQVFAVLASKHCPITWSLRHQFNINWCLKYNF